MKECSICKVKKELKDFYSQNKSSNKKGEYIYYHPECKQCSKSKSIKWRNENRQRWLDSNKRSNSKPEKRAKMDLARKNYRKEGKWKQYYNDHKYKFKGYQENRKDKIHEISEQEWIECKEYFDCSCAYCGLTESEHLDKYSEQLHKDHADPSGSNKIDNCVPACKSCNSSKSDNLMEEWYNPNNHRFIKARMDKIHIWLRYHKNV